MIQFSFSSVLMTVLTSNLLLILVALFFRNEKTLARVGYRLTAVYCAVTLIRLLFPCELPFTKTVVLPSGISNLFALLRHPYEVIPGIRLSAWEIFCFLWLGGSILYIALFLFQYKILKHLALRNSRDITGQEPYASLLRKVCNGKRYDRIRLCISPYADAPMIIGLLNPIILLPRDAEPTDMDVMYALRHEVCHYMHHDLWLKFGINCLVVAYWWNPFTHLLNRQIDTLLEIRVDTSIISEGEDASIGYVTSMLHYMSGSRGNSNTTPRHMRMFLEKRSDLKHRLHMIQCNGRKPNFLLSFLMLLVVLSLYLGSYLVIFENCSYAPLYKESEAYIVPNQENCYAIKNADGTYNIYFVDWKVFETVNSLDHYQGIEIYSSEEEYNEKTQNL